MKGTGIIQQIPNYYLGMSEQPDQLKLPGQLKNIVNAIPDVTWGLYKRPGSKRIGTNKLANVQSGGSWFHYYRDETEGSYLGQIAADGKIRMWCTEDLYDGLGAKVNSAGDEIFVHYHTVDTNHTQSNYDSNTSDHTSITSYLAASNTEDVQTLTLLDSTFLNNRTKTVSLEGTTDANVQKYLAYVELLRTENGRQYSLNIFNNETTTPITKVTRIEHTGNSLATGNQTGSCRGIGTQVFDATAQGVNTSDSTKNYNSSPIVNINENDNDNGWNTTAPAASNKKNLIYRITALGQTSQHSSSSDDGSVDADDFRCTYNIDVDLLHGGEGFALNDRIQTKMTSAKGGDGSGLNNSDPATYTIRVRDLETVNVKANIKAVRPKPTPFDSDTAVSSDSILGGIESEIDGSFSGVPTLAKSQVNTGNNQITANNHPYQTGDKTKYDNTGTGTYSQSGTTVTVTLANHGFSSSDSITFDFTSGTAVDGTFTITVSDANTFTFTAAGSLTTEGEVTITGASIGGLTHNNEYYVIVVDTNTIKLATNLANANAGTAINLTSTGNNSQTLRSYIQKQVIGNGIFLWCDTKFNVEIINRDLMRVMQSEINDVSLLPNQCKDGYIIKVSNSQISDEDDYYLKFVGENNLDGNGNWEECAKPGIEKGFNATTMPHYLQRQTIVNGKPVIFLVKKYTWADRTVGDDVTNEAPLFVGNKINKVLFFRNRLVFLSGQNITTARAGEFAVPNFWAETALTVAPTDPINISSSSMFPSDLFDGIELTGGLLVFSTNQQFLLSSDDTILNPDTAKLKSISSFNYNKIVSPISLGTTVGYLDNSGKFSRFNEIGIISRENEPVIVETSKLVPSLLPKSIDIISNSRENQIVLFTSTTDTDNHIVYGFKYLNLGEQRPQASWFKWKFNNPIKHHFISDDQFFYLDGDNFLQALNLIQSDDISITEDNVNYLIHLDNYLTGISGGNYSSTTNKTTFTQSWVNDISTPNYDLAVIDSDGKYGIATETSGAFTVDGDWSGMTLNVGYLYDYQVDFPTLYVTSAQGTRVISDANGSLVIHRLNLNFGKVGSYRTTLSRTGKPDYTEIYESALSDDYDAGDAPYRADKIKTIPVYEKNSNVDITLKSINPTPATLHSMSWEGSYTQNYYKRV